MWVGEGLKLNLITLCVQGIIWCNYVFIIIYAAVNSLLLEMSLEAGCRDIGRFITILIEGRSFTASSKGCCKLLRG